MGDESIVTLFGNWVAERDLDGKAAREGMDWVEKTVSTRADRFHKTKFFGRLLLGPPVLPDGYEVYLTRRRSLAYYLPDGNGGGQLDVYKDREAFAAGEPKAIAEAVYIALDEEVEELDL